MSQQKESQALSQHAEKGGIAERVDRHRPQQNKCHQRVTAIVIRTGGVLDQNRRIEPPSAYPRYLVKCIAVFFAEYGQRALHPPEGRIGSLMNDCQSVRLGNQNVIAAKAQQPVPVLEPRHPCVEGTDIEQRLTLHHQRRTRAEAAAPHEGLERALLGVWVKISECLVTLVVDAVATDAG